MRFIGRESVTHCNSWCGRPQFCTAPLITEAGAGNYKLIKDEASGEVAGENEAFDFEHSMHWDLWMKGGYVPPPDDGDALGGAADGGDNDPNQKEMEL